MSKEWSAGQVLKVLSDRIEHLDNEMHRELLGFPEQYATNAHVDAMREAIEAIRSDHVARREIDEIKKSQVGVAERLQVRLDEQSGRRQATIVAVSVIATILAVTFGFIWNSQLSGAEVSDQIQREAPWNKDKVQVEARLSKLEAQTQAQRIQISKMETQIRFFCATRVQANLPGC